MKKLGKIDSEMIYNTVKSIFIFISAAFGYIDLEIDDASRDRHPHALLGRRLEVNAPVKFLELRQRD